MKKYVWLALFLCVAVLRADINVDNLDLEGREILVDALTYEVDDEYAAAAKKYKKLFPLLKKVNDKASCKLSEADCWFRANKTAKASEAYLYLVRHYALYVPFATVVPNMRTLAENYVAGIGTFWGLTDVDAAIGVYNTILLEAPAIHASLADRIRLAELYRQRNKNAEAIAVYQEALKLDPTLNDIRLQMCKMLINMSHYGDGDGAIRRMAARNAQMILDNAPDYDKKEEVQMILVEAQEVEASKLLELGQFYLRPSHYNVKASKQYLLELAKKYPESQAAWKGNALLQTLDAPTETK